MKIATELIVVLSCLAPAIHGKGGGGGGGGGTGASGGARASGCVFSLLFGFATVAPVHSGQFTSSHCIYKSADNRAACDG